MVDFNAATDLAEDFSADAVNGWDALTKNHTEGYITAGWAPISTFNGTYNGGTKNISNLKINRSGTDNVGLFAQTTTGGSITDVRLTDVVGITGKTNVGALVGKNAASIERCSVTGVATVSTALTGNDEVYVGGLIGYTNGAISNSYSTLNVGSAGNGNYVGGLVGQLDGVVVDKCYTTGSVAGNIGVGGITGGRTTSTSATVRNCVALGASITGSDSSLIGGITGGDGSTVPSLSGCYAIGTMELIPTRPLNADYDGTPATDVDTKTATFWTDTVTYDTGDTGVWNIEKDSYPTLKNIP